MRVLLIILLVFLLMPLSCGSPGQQDAPLTRDQMVNLMLKIYLAEARASMLPLQKDSSYRLFLAHQDSLMRRQGISDSTLRKAYSYYLERPAELEAIYDAIIDSLSLREQRGH